MTIALHPRCAPAGRVRAWIGVSDCTDIPNPAWELRRAGSPALIASTPTALQPLASVRTPDLVEALEPRVFAGLYEFAGLVPGEAYTLNVTVGQEQASILVRSLPAALPRAPDEWFNILLVSCYHAAEANPVLVENAVREATEDCAGYGGHVKELHLSILLGDQVYLDLPTLQDFPSDARWLANKFERDYRRNWFGPIGAAAVANGGPAGYAAVLAAAPAVCVPDDHEYWNNFPHASPFIENSWKFEDRRSWRQAARALFCGFQLHDPQALGDPVIVDVPPLSIFVGDTRTFRGREYQEVDSIQARAFDNSMKNGAIDRLSQWVAEVNARNAFGVFITGQSLLSAPAGAIARHIGDAEIANYGDYPAIMRALLGLANPGAYITGDVHWGRVAELTDPRQENRTVAYEIITSPCALVTTVGSDALARGWSAIKSLFGAKDPWPRHSKGDKAPGKFAPMPGASVHCDTRRLQEGDQVAVLSVQQQGDDPHPLVNARLRFYPIHSDPAVRKRFKFETAFTLRPNVQIP